MELFVQLSKQYYKTGEKHYVVLYFNPKNKIQLGLLGNKLC